MQWKTQKLKKKTEMIEKKLENEKKIRKRQMEVLRPSKKCLSDVCILILYENDFTIVFINQIFNLGHDQSETLIRNLQFFQFFSYQTQIPLINPCCIYQCKFRYMLNYLPQFPCFCSTVRYYSSGFKIIMSFCVRPVFRQK